MSTAPADHEREQAEFDADLAYMRGLVDRIAEAVTA